MIDVGGTVGVVRFGKQPTDSLRGVAFVSVVSVCCVPQVAVGVVGGRIKQSDVLRSDWQFQAVLNRVNEDVIPQNVTLDREHERVPAAFQTLEKIRTTETHEPSACPRQIVQRTAFFRRRRIVG